MKMRNVAFSLILVVGIAFSLIQGQAWGWGGVTDPYEVNPKAHGTQYSGPLSVYLEPVGNNSVHMYFLVSLSHKKDSYFYSWDVGPVDYTQQSLLEAFHTFIETKLIPDICTVSPCPTFDDGRVALKSITDNFYYSWVPGTFFIADIVIAVKQ
jgi:hypothetical protein